MSNYQHDLLLVESNESFNRFLSNLKPTLPKEFQNLLVHVDTRINDTIWCLFPDGSKEGWETSNTGDSLREVIKRAASECKTYWVEVSFGDFGEVVRFGRINQDVLEMHSEQ